MFWQTNPKIRRKYWLDRLSQTKKEANQHAALAAGLCPTCGTLRRTHAKWWAHHSEIVLYHCDRCDAKKIPQRNELTLRKLR